MRICRLLSTTLAVPVIIITIFAGCSGMPQPGTPEYAAAVERERQYAEARTRAEATAALQIRVCVYPTQGEEGYFAKGVQPFIMDAQEYNRGAVFRKVAGAENTTGCDMMLGITWRRSAGYPHYSAQAASAHTEEPLFSTAERSVGFSYHNYEPLAKELANRFSGGLAERLAAERREAKRKSQQAAALTAPATGLTKGDLKEIVKEVVEGTTQAQKKGTEPNSVMTSDVDKPSYQMPENPNNFAIVIGIEKYSEVPEAQFAERDAEAVKDHLLASGYPSRNVVLLSGEKAGRAGIEKFVETWLPRNVNENSRVFFYFSGHGAPDAETKQAYLVPWDGDPKFLENTAYPVKRLYEKLNALPAKEVVVALDTCFSGLGGRSVVPKGSRPMGLALQSPVASIGRLVVFTASGNDEISGAEDTQGHGLFTYYFLKGLNGGTKEPDGHVTAQGLHKFLSPEVQNVARRQNRSQTPQLLPVQSGERASLVLR